MQLAARLGNPTWSCEGADLCLVGDSHVCAVDFEGLLHLFDLSTGASVSSWSKEDEQLNRVAFDGKETFFVGGSFGCIYSLEWREGKLQLREEREAVSYVDKLEYSEKHGLLAVVCEEELKLLPGRGKKEALTLRFSETVRSVRWCEQLDIFLILCTDALYSVTPTGKQSKLFGWKSRLLAAKFHAGTDSFVLLCGVTDNEAELIKIDRLSQSVIWRLSVLLDRFEFQKVNPREWDHGVGSIEVHPTSGEIVVAGLNWVGRYDTKGTPLGSLIGFSQMIEVLSSSSNGSMIAVSLGGAGLHVWNHDFTPLLPRDCHYSSVTSLAFAKDDSLIVSSCDFSPEVICWDIAAETPKWVDDFGGFWADGILVPNSAAGQFVVASSSSTITRLVSVSQSTGEIVHDMPIECGFRATVKQLPNGEITLAPSWAYGPSRVVALLEPGKFEVTKIFAGDHRLFAVTASRSWIIACDEDHIWTWERNDLANARDLEIPEVESRSLGDSIVSTLMTSDISFIAVSRKRAFRYSLPDGHPLQLAEFASAVSCVSNPKNGRVILGFADGHAEVRSLPDFTQEHSWIAHPGHRVTSSTFAHEKNSLATGASDGSASIWELEKQ